MSDTSRTDMVRWQNQLSTKSASAEKPRKSILSGTIMVGNQVYPAQINEAELEAQIRAQI